MLNDWVVEPKAGATVYWEYCRDFANVCRARWWYPAPRPGHVQDSTNQPFYSYEQKVLGTTTCSARQAERPLRLHAAPRCFGLALHPRRHRLGGLRKRLLLMSTPPCRCGKMTMYMFVPRGFREDGPSSWLEAKTAERAERQRVGPS
jgi:hypothetical protein